MSSLLNKFFTHLLLFILLSVEIAAQQFPITHYTRDRELPGNQVWSIFQDSKGYMWFATSAGLIKYNGKEYETLGEKNGLLNDWPLGITEDTRGVIWVSSDKGVSAIKKNKIETYVLSESEDRLNIFADSYGRVWVHNTLFPGDVFYFKDDSLYNFSSEFGFKNQVIMNTAEDNEGNIFFLTRSGKLYRFFANKITEYDIFLKDAGVRYAFFDSDNNLIICAQKGIGVIYYKNLNSSPKVEWLNNTPVNYGFKSRKGGYWFASNHKGLLKIKDIAPGNIHEQIRLTEENGLLSNHIKIIFEDREDNIWVGYDLKGISKISTLMFYKYDNVNGLDANAIFSINKINNSLICSTEKGLFIFSNKKFEKISLPEDYDNLWYLSLLPLEGNEYLLGSVPGLFKITSGKSITLTGLEKKMIQTMIKDHTGKIWIGTHEGLYTFDKGNIIEHDSNIKERAIFSLLEVNNKDIYAGTDKGLFIFENAVLPFGKKKVITPENIYGYEFTDFIGDLKIDSDSSLLIAASNGLKVLTSDKKLYNVDGLKDVEIITLHIDMRGRVWAGTTNGLYVLQKHEGKYIVTHKFTKKDGLASDEFSFNNTIYEDTDGKIYFGMFGGMAVYNPSEDFSVTAKPKAYIKDIRVNDSTFIINDSSQLKLSYLENKISFHCEGLSFINEDAVKFEYYLHPIEKEWSNSSSSSLISYGYLEPNEYTFYVRAINQFGIISDEQSISFAITPPFWQSGWFIISAMVLLIFAGYLVNNYRQAHIRKRNLLLEKLVKEKTKDLEESKEQLEKQYHQLVSAQKELVEKRELEKAKKEIELLKEKLAKENIYLREKQGIIHEVSSIIGNSKAIQEVRKKVVEIAKTDSTVLITGSTGVGKNLIAEAIHDLSSRKERALITVNCAAIPDSLVESELFGYEKGAFTGAVERREGKFEVAEGSTILLDEIGDMPLPVQAKLLNVLQSKKFMRVGGNKLINADVRIIAATNHNFAELIEQGKFRQDLFYRINIYTIHIPDLKDRPEDIEPIAKYFIGRYSMMLNKKINAITKSALNILQNYPYPGNIRELENIIHRAVIICKGNAITDEDILIQSETIKTPDGNGSGELLSLEEMERNYILKVLNRTNWKIRGEGGAAEILKINAGTLRSRMKKLSIPFVREVKN